MQHGLMGVGLPMGLCINPQEVQFEMSVVSTPGPEYRHWTTVSVAGTPDDVIAPSVAVIDAVPVARAVASPCDPAVLLIVATVTALPSWPSGAVVSEAQVTDVVRICV